MISKKVSVALFTPYVPYPPNTGGKVRSYYLIKGLASEMDVDVYCTSHELPSLQDVAEMRRMVRRLWVLSVDKPRRWRDSLRRILAPCPRLVDYFHDHRSLMEAQIAIHVNQYDVLISDELCMIPYVELCSDLPKVLMRQKIDSAHVEQVASAHPFGIESILYRVEARKLRKYENQKIKLFHACITCSEKDAEIVRQDAPGIRILVIPNGVDLEMFRPPSYRRLDPPILLFVGTMHYYPNIDAMRYFFKEIYPIIRQERPDIRVQIVGHRPPSEIQRLAELPGVEVTGGVPDVRPYYAQASVFIVPLRLGGGTRLKIMEAMAMGLPVVSTSVGAEGLDIHPGEDILIADDPRTFAQEVLGLLSDRNRWTHLSAGGRRLAHRYDWRELTRPLVELVEALARERRG